MNWPNRITMARIVAIPFFISALLFWSRGASAVVFTIIAATDLVDGWLARRKKQTSEAGAVLDPLADKLLVSAALLFLIDKGVDAWMAYVIIAREFIVTGLRVLVKSKDIIVASWLGKVKTLSQNVAIVMVILSIPFSWHAMLVATLLTIISGLDYVLRARKSVKL